MADFSEDKNGHLRPWPIMSTFRGLFHKTCSTAPQLHQQTRGFITAPLTLSGPSRHIQWSSYTQITITRAFLFDWGSTVLVYSQSPPLKPRKRWSIPANKKWCENPRENSYHCLRKRHIFVVMLPLNRNHHQTKTIPFFSGLLIPLQASHVTHLTLGQDSLWWCFPWRPLELIL